MLVTAVALAFLFPAGRVIVCQAEHAEHGQEAKKEAGKDIKGSMPPSNEFPLYFS